MVKGTANGAAEDDEVDYDKMEDLIDDVLGKDGDDNDGNEDDAGDDDDDGGGRGNSKEDNDSDDEFFYPFKECAV